MTGRKALLAKCLASGGMLPAISRMRTACRADVPILAYHRIWDIGNEDAFPYDVELVSASTGDFAWQMEYVRENFNPITFSTFLNILEGKTERPPKPIIITFDDGFDDNYHHAFPILSAFNVPATIFLSTGYIDTKHTFWYDRLTHCILNAPVQTIDLKDLPEPVVIASSVRERRDAVGKLLRILKRVPNELRLSIVRQVEERCGLSAEDVSLPESLPLNWNQVREMSEAGIEFGSHTVTHPILANLTDDALWHELAESKRMIEYQLGKPIDVISYPVGGLTAFDTRVRRMAEAAGYRFGCSYIPGTNSWKRLDAFALNRLHVERYTDRSYFAAMLSLPELFR